MKKLVCLVVAFVGVCLFIACSGDEGIIESITPYTPKGSEIATTLPSTEVYVQGACISSGVDTRLDWPVTRDYSWGDLKWPSVNTAEGTEVARFTIRIDGTIPGWLNEKASKYWGGNNAPNLGKIATGYAYGTYDDRGLDYYQRDKKTGNNVGMFRYVYDEKGLATQNAIVQVPDIPALLTFLRDKETGETDNKVALQAAIDGLKNNELKVLWYVVKEVGMQYGWHVNGILTKNEVEIVSDVQDPEVVQEVNSEVEEGGLEDTDPFDVIPNNVEVDIHLQEHSDWNQIKTSIHIRAHAGEVTINLPLAKDNVIEQDDFDIRVYDYYFKEYNTVKTQVTHNDSGITIKISGVTDDMVDELKEAYGDGLTIEVNSYCKKLDGVWEELKNSTVATEKDCTVKGQITSAYTAEKKEL